MRAVDRSSGLIARYVDARQQETAANATINRELAALKRMFRLAQQATPPKVLRTPAFPKLAENNARTGFLTDTQRDALAAQCAMVGLWLRTMYEVGCTYGWRVSEVKGLLVRHVDIGAHTIRLDPGTTKNGQGRVVTFEAQSTLCELLAACVHGKSADDSVITREDGKPVRDFRDTWAKVCKAAGVPGLLFHDLRRTAARNLRRAGVAASCRLADGGLAAYLTGMRLSQRTTSWTRFASWRLTASNGRLPRSKFRLSVTNQSRNQPKCQLGLQTQSC